LVVLDDEDGGGRGVLHAVAKVEKTAA